jgi:CRP/FNR family transcriptional regulator, cyclic AMP receptor protein
MAAREKKPVVMGRSWLNVLTTVPLLAGLSKRHLARIAELATQQRFPGHTDIVRSGEPGSSVFVILDGTATVRRTGRRSATLGPGEFFGEMAVLDGAERTATVTSDTDIEVMVIGRKDLLKLLETEPKLAVGMLTSMAGRLRAAQSSPSD